VYCQFVIVLTLRIPQNKLETIGFRSYEHNTEQVEGMSSYVSRPKKVEDMHGLIGREEREIVWQEEQ
jgi:hypothetical protein